MKDRIEKLKEFLQENYANIQTFNSRNLAGDSMENVYDEDNIQVDYCADWKYIEIFGLTQEEFEELLDEDSLLGDNLKTFKKVELEGEK